MQLGNKKRGKGKASKIPSESGRKKRRQGEKVKARKWRKKRHLYNGVAKDKEEMKGRQSESSARKMKKRHLVNDGAESRTGTSREEKWSGNEAKGSVEWQWCCWPVFLSAAEWWQALTLIMLMLGYPRGEGAMASWCQGCRLVSAMGWPTLSLFHSLLGLKGEGKHWEANGAKVWVKTHQSDKPPIDRTFSSGAGNLPTCQRTFGSLPFTSG